MNEVTETKPATKKGLVNKMAGRFGVDEGAFMSTLRNTAFKTKDGQVSNEQLMALMIVADQHGLNPFLKEIYAFPDKGGVVPVVGVDGWARIINEHPQFDGMEFEQDEESCTCIMHRKDRSRPIKVTEYMSECKRGTGPWGSHPRRMLRHKAMIQCARLAFSFAGIYDPDEAEAIVENRGNDYIDAEPARTVERPALPSETLAQTIDRFRDTIAAGDMTTANVIAMLETKYTLTDEQCNEISALGELVEQEVAA